MAVGSPIEWDRPAFHDPSEPDEREACAGDLNLLMGRGDFDKWFLSIEHYKHGIAPADFRFREAEAKALEWLESRLEAALAAVREARRGK